MLINEKHLAELNSPVQTINARVELHNGSTLVQICTCKDYLSNLTIERVGEGKFFGYGMSHKLIVNFIDPNKELNLTNIDFIEVTFGVDGDFIYPFPTFHILEVERDEATNDIRVVAFDLLYQAANHKVNELELPQSYNILYFASACCALLGISLKFDNVTDISAFLTEFPNGANFDGTETLRQALDAIAEATQTVYYLNGDWQLTFKRLNHAGDPVLTIDRNQYIDLKSGANCTLGAICHTTELGDAITAGSAENGVIQYIRDNPFLELREDAYTLLDKAIALVGGSTINPFECNWIGNYLLEIGDKIALVREDGSEIITYIVDDSITFDGTLGQSSRWEFISDEAETADNPSSLGEALNKTFARVDKVNKQIELVVGDTAENKQEISQLKLTTESISASVEKVEQTSEAHTSQISALQMNANSISASVRSIEENIETSHDTINENYEKLTKEVNTKITAEDVQIAISQELANGVNSVKTTTGFIFDSEGLTVSKSDSEISTIITEDGMSIDKNGTEVLRADNQGVIAKDLHAVTYLWIGDNSRFEDQGNRTACFWVSD